MEKEITKAVYAGSFNPFTSGHLSIFLKASKIFDQVTILMADNPEKKAMFNAALMEDAIRETVFPGEGVLVARTIGFVADYCKQNNIKYLVRGLRNNMDFQYEEEIAKVNKELNPELETIYFRSDNEIISSSLVRMLAVNHKPFFHYVPKSVHEAIMKDMGTEEYQKWEGK